MAPEALEADYMTPEAPEEDCMDPEAPEAPEAPQEYAASMAKHPANVAPEADSRWGGCSLLWFFYGWVCSAYNRRK